MGELFHFARNPAATHGRLESQGKVKGSMATRRWTLKPSQKRIHQKTSRTAQYTCVSRAASFVDRRPGYQGPDYVAWKMIPGFIRFLLWFPGAPRLLAGMTAPWGVYEYVIARTAFMDAKFEAALREGFDQAVIFGAGFDSRAQRFAGLNRGTRIFELDAPIIQEEKKKAYQRKGIPIPPELTFVPLDLNRLGLEESLEAAGYRAGVRSFFMLEGLLMYLTSEAVAQTFAFLGRSSAPGSRVAFDFVWAGVAQRPGDYHGGEEIVRRVGRAGEPWSFFLEEQGLRELLAGSGFSLEDLADSEELERRYFAEPGGRLRARINATHALAVGVRD